MSVPDRTLLSTTIYQSLHQLAANQLRGRQAVSLQPTALVHEAWLRIAGLDEVRAQQRAQFFALAGKAMRSVLVDHARRRMAHKRGAAQRLDIDIEQLGIDGTPCADILALDQALQQLEQQDPELVQVVELMFFCGKTAAEIGELIGTSSRTVERRWRFARAWLREALADHTAE
jgi:RNA polymerase sigma factor (TIGR02999 family)